MKINYRGKSAIIVCHDSVYGPPHELRDYFLKRSMDAILFIGHHNRYLKDNLVRASYYETYRGGKLVRKYVAKEYDVPEPVAYIHDFILTLLWSMRFGPQNVTYFIGLGNLNALAGLVIRAFRTVSYVVYYVIDYSPVRFKNAVMNSVYHSMDYMCARYSSQTWNYAKRMIAERGKRWRINFPNQKVVPNGITIKHNLPGPAKNKPYEISYIGTLYKQQGILFVVDAMRALVKRIPRVHLTIIGMGDLDEEIARRVTSYGLKKQITLKGFIPDPYKADAIVSKANLGLAMYDPNSGFVMYTEPGKIKRYLSCSVPVIMTDVSPLAAEIVKRKCGFCSPYKTNAFTDIVVRYFSDPAKVATYRSNALSFAENYSWEKIFDKSLKSLSDSI